jgi:lipoate-protein ligase B
MRTLLFKDLGTIDYLSALALQEKLLERRQAGELTDILLVLEHPHVFTLGRAGKEQHLLNPGAIPFYRTSRGGDMTYHGPGQIIVYPIIDLRSRLRKAVHGYLRRLEQVTMRTLQRFGIPARRMPPWSGIWIEKRKIASIGIAVRRRVSYHGLALNVSTNLSYFSRIVPCGLAWAQTTSMEKELGEQISLGEVKEEWVRNFVTQFGYQKLEELCPEDIQIGSKSKLPVVPTISASSGF